MTSANFQPVVTNAYPHRWLIFRCCDGDYLDRKVQANLAWAVHARATGKLDGFAVYVVYRPGLNASILNHLNNTRVPADCHVMIDCESWGGQIHGNHSTDLNALADKLAARQGSRERVWGYANRGDYSGIWPSRPAWLGLVVASYGGVRPTSPGPGPLAGWQYTDGQYSVPGLPSSSAPFGHCDHNQLFLTTTEDDMPLSADDLAKIRRECVEPYFLGTDGKQHSLITLVRAELKAALLPQANSIVTALTHVVARVIHNKDGQHPNALDELGPIIRDIAGKEKS